MNNKITILVCCHKQDYYAQKYPFLPIQVGRAISSVDLGIQGDDTGDNISWKNRNYCVIVKAEENNLTLLLNIPVR